MSEVKLKKIKPMFTAIVTTAEKYTDTQFIPGTKLIDATSNKSGLKEYQTVVAVGSAVRNVKEGDLVCINPERYAVRKFTNRNDANQNSIANDMADEYYKKETVGYTFNMVYLDDVPHLLLQENDIDFVVEDYEII